MFIEEFLHKVKLMINYSLITETTIDDLQTQLNNSKKSCKVNSTDIESCTNDDKKNPFFHWIASYDHINIKQSIQTFKVVST